MARALTAEWQHIPPADQPEAASRWRARHDILARHGCHHWIFRSPTNPDAFLEFIEGADADVLSKARAGAGMNAPVEILTELELS
jgi:hypothetical protein